MFALVARLLRLFGPRYRLDPIAADYLERSGRVGKTDQIPTELLPLAARLWARGWFNRQILDTVRDWVLPFWLTRQLDPTDRGFIGRALQPVVLNSAYRNWTALGNSESKLEAIVDPRGLVTPQPNGRGWSLDAWLRVDGQTFFPSRLRDADITQKLYENLPLVQTQYEPARLRMNQEAFAIQASDGSDWLIATYAVENPRGDARSATCYVSLRPFNPEGAAVVDEIEWRAQSLTGELWVNGALGAVMTLPDAFGSSNAAAGDVNLDALNNIATVSDPTGLATFVAAYNFELKPHTQRLITVAMPLAKTTQPSPHVHSGLPPMHCQN